MALFVLGGCALAAAGSPTIRAEDATTCRVEMPLRGQRSLAAIQQRLAELKTVDRRPDREKRLEVSKMLYYQARYTADKSAKRELLEQAIAITTAARQDDPKSPGALIGFAAAKGELARIKNIFVALKYVREAEEALGTLREVDPAYAHYAAERGLGMLYEEAPAVISVGSSKKAKAELEASIQGEGDYPGNLVAMAHFLARHGEPDQARTLARRALAGAADPKHVVEAYDWTREACEILEKVGGL